MSAREPDEADLVLLELIRNATAGEAAVIRRGFIRMANRPGSGLPASMTNTMRAVRARMDRRSS